MSHFGTILHAFLNFLWRHSFPISSMTFMLKFHFVEPPLKQPGHKYLFFSSSNLIPFFILITTVNMKSKTLTSHRFFLGQICAWKKVYIQYEGCKISPCRCPVSRQFLRECPSVLEKTAFLASWHSFWTIYESLSIINNIIAQFSIKKCIVWKLRLQMSNKNPKTNSEYITIGASQRWIFKDSYKSL